MYRVKCQEDRGWTRTWMGISGALIGRRWASFSSGGGIVLVVVVLVVTLLKVLSLALARSPLQSFPVWGARVGQFSESEPPSTSSLPALCLLSYLPKNLTYLHRQAERLSLIIAHSMKSQALRRSDPSPSRLIPRPHLKRTRRVETPCSFFFLFSQSRATTRLPIRTWHTWDKSLISQVGRRGDSPSDQYIIET